MPDSWVLDASVAAKLCFTESDSTEAEAVVRAAGSLLAPDLIFVELASVAAKQVRRNGVAIETARQALALAETLLDEAVPTAGLVRSALDFAALHGVSAYDGTYLALAQERGLPLLTADERLLRRLNERGLAQLARPMGA